MKTLTLIAALPLLALAACGPSTTTTVESDNGATANLTDGNVEIVDLPDEGIANDAAGNAADATAGWTGRWVGVEGLNLVIAPDAKAGVGHYRLTMQYGVDETDKGVFEGVADGATIRFTRPDGAQVLKPGNGDDTGLKWLAGKSDCLVVKPGEGYCRD